MSFISFGMTSTMKSPQGNRPGGPGHARSVDETRPIFKGSVTAYQRLAGNPAQKTREPSTVALPCIKKGDGSPGA